MLSNGFGRRLLLVTVAVGFAGSAHAQTTPSAPPPSAAPVIPSAPPVPNTAVEPELPRVSDPMLEPVAEPKHVLRTWQEALARVRSQSTAIRTARARTAQAEAEARLALSPALPTLTGNGSIQHHLLRSEGLALEGTNVVTRNLPDPPTSLNGSLTLGVPLLALGAWYNHGTARDAVEVSRLNRLETERLEVATVANAIVAVVTAERLAEVSRVSLQSALSTLDLNRRRAELGASSTVDVLRTEQEVSITRSQVVTANEGVLRARETLGLALGSTDGWGIAPDIRLDSLATDAKASCTQERDVRTRPDVRAADANARLAERDAKAPSYDFWPTIDAVSTVAYNSIDENTANREHVTWTIGAVLTWPIYDGGARYATRAARSAQAVVAREQLTDLQRRASVEVTQAYRGVTTAEHNLAIARKTRDISFETARLARVAFLNGSGTSFDLVDTARQLREAELDLAIQEFEVLRARITALLALATCRV